MTPMLDLWLPIVLCAVIVFIASAFVWMAIPAWHQPDVKVLPDEGAFKSDLAKHDLPPGRYMWPNCGSTEEWKSDEFQQRHKNGPWGVLVVPRGAPSFPRNLLVTFLLFLGVSVIVGFLASRAFEPGAAYFEVFTFCGLASALTYCSMGLPNSAFMMDPLRGLLTCLVDGFVFALLTAGTFAGLWPEIGAISPN